MAYIKRIELDGFKSFGLRHTSVEFTDSFNAVVGPNGSGKSNIVDGINFVLGGLSAKSMRAQKFSDLIFSGSKGHVGAKKASVSVVFDNSDNAFMDSSNEIIISRVVDLKGNSKYLVNGKRMTRTKILDLISSARIFPDGHNIILQGDVADIIGMSPNERIEIIKEIAGISEYEYKKENSLKELENVEENFSKIEWIQNETKARLEELELQKKDLDNFNKLEEDLEKCENALLSARISELKEDMQKYESNIEKYKESIEKRKDKLREYNEQINDKKAEIESFEDDLSIRGEEEWVRLGREIEKETLELKNYRESCSEIENRIEYSKKEIDRLENEKENTISEIKSIDSQIKEIEGERKSSDEKIKQIQLKLDEAHKRVSEFTQEYEEKKTESNKINKKFSKVSDQYMSLKVDTEKLSAQIKDRQSFFSKFSGRKKKLEEKINSQKKKLDDILVFEENLKNKRSQLLNRNDHFKRQLSEKKKILDNQESKLKSLYRQFDREDTRRKAADYGGYDRAIKELMQVRDNGLISGIYGTIAQLGKVEDKYQNALQTAAGSRLKYIIVSDDVVAKDCIEYLKSKKAGRASFIPLNKINVPRMSNSAQQAIGRVGVVDFAINLIDYDSKFESAFKFVFGDTVVIDNLNSAKKIGIGKGVRMATLYGDIVEKGGVMRGGHKKPTNLGFSKDNLTALHEEISIYERENSQLQSDVELIRNELASNSDKLSEIHVEIKKNSVEKDSIHEEINRLVEEINELDSSGSDSWADVSKIEDELSIKLQKLTDIEAKYLDLKIKKEELDEILSDYGSRRDPEIVEYSKQLEKLRSDYQAKDSKLSSLAGRLNEGLKPKIEEIDKRISELRLEIKNSNTSLSEKQKEIEKLKKVLKSKVEREEELKKELKKIRFRRAEIRAEIEKLRRKVERTNVDISNKELQMREDEVKHRNLSQKVEKLEEKLGRYPEIKENIEQIKVKMKKLDQEIEQLRPKLNMRADEEYDIYFEKKEEIDSKLSKLLSEKDAIIDYMNMIEAKKEEVFMNTFNEISKNFEEIFQKLSPQGTGKLILDNKEEPLEGGLDMQAQPEGKKIKRLASMSGGEKSLTAIAFIFSIQRYKPAPFYVLDEIDAFLDDENVDRVARLIRESANTVQQIVITHRDVMMSQASLLYGVSMSEGISNIISMKLEEAESLIKEATA